jgi:hypothetical protein
MEGNQPPQTEDLDKAYSTAVNSLDMKNQRDHERKIKAAELEHERKLKEAEIKLEKCKAESLRLQYSPAAIELEKQKMEHDAQRSREAHAHQERLLSMYIEWAKLTPTQRQEGSLNEPVGLLPTPPPPPLIPSMQVLNQRLDTHRVADDIDASGSGSGEMEDVLPEADTSGY